MNFLFLMLAQFTFSAGAAELTLLNPEKFATEEAYEKAIRDHSVHGATTDEISGVRASLRGVSLAVPPSWFAYAVESQKNGPVIYVEPAQKIASADASAATAGKMSVFFALWLDPRADDKAGQPLSDREKNFRQQRPKGKVEHVSVLGHDWLVTDSESTTYPEKSAFNFTAICGKLLCKATALYDTKNSEHRKALLGVFKSLQGRISGK